jgi:hypothetical protein
MTNVAAVNSYSNTMCLSELESAKNGRLFIL